MQWKHLKLKVCWSVGNLAGGRWRPRARERRRCNVSSAEIGNMCLGKKEASANVAASVGGLDNDCILL